MIHLKLFNNEDEFYEGKDNLLFPWVCLIDDIDKVYYQSDKNRWMSFNKWKNDLIWNN